MTFRTDTTDIGQLNYNKNSFLILLGQRNKYSNDTNSKWVTYLQQVNIKSTTKIANIKFQLSTFKQHSNFKLNKIGKNQI